MSRLLQVAIQLYSLPLETIMWSADCQTRTSTYRSPKFPQYQFKEHPSVMETAFPSKYFLAVRSLKRSVHWPSSHLQPVPSSTRKLSTASTTSTSIKRQRLRRSTPVEIIDLSYINDDDAMPAKRRCGIKRESESLDTDSVRRRKRTSRGYLRLV